jgi:hypothetical protein
MATKTAKTRVKTTKVSGSVRRRSKPLNKAQIEEIVAEAVYMNDPFVKAYNGTAALVGGVATTATTTLKSITDGLAHVAGQVWVFLGNVYETVLGYASAVVQWLGEQITYATGKCREAFEYVSELVGSMSIDWIAVNGAVINLLCAAAAFGVAVTVGTAVGVVVGGTAVSIVGAGTVAKVTALLFAAVTANCVAPVAYTLFKSGVSREVIAEGLQAAEDQQRDPRLAGWSPVTPVVNAQAVMPATT